MQQEGQAERTLDRTSAMTPGFDIAFLGRLSVYCNNSGIRSDLDSRAEGRKPLSEQRNSASCAVAMRCCRRCEGGVVFSLSLSRPSAYLPASLFSRPPGKKRRPKPVSECSFLLLRVKRVCLGRAEERRAGACGRRDLGLRADAPKRKGVDKRLK